MLENAELVHEVQHIENDVEEDIMALQLMYFVGA
jgi:hypothetical protein